MQSDKQQGPNTYLQGVLLDGAKPFRYRIGVRTLLGMPEGEADHLAFSKSLPPVGFRYENSTFLTGSHLTNQGFRSEVASSSLESELLSGGAYSQSVAPERMESDAPIDNTRIDTTSEVDQDRELKNRISRNSASIKDIVRQHNAGPSDRPKQGTVEPDSIPEMQNTGRSGHGGVEIPGISERRQIFPAIISAKKDDGKLNNAEERSEQETSCEDSHWNSAGKSRSETQENKPLIQSTLNTGHTAEKIQKEEKGKKRPSVTREARAANQVLDVPPVGPEETRKIASHRRLSDSKPASFPVFNRTNNRAVANIDQLRQAVHQLVSKTSGQHGKEENQKESKRNEQTPPPPVQPPAQSVVIIKRPSQQGRTPCAFWERSYMGRALHMRILR